MIGQLVRDPAADPRQLVELSGLGQRDAELLLLRQLPGSSDERARTILQLLAVCGTPRSTPQLLRLSQRDTVRTDALATIERIAGLHHLAAAARQTADRRVRAAICQRLFASDSETALDAYLSLVGDEAMRADALAVANAVSETLLPILLARLETRMKGAAFPRAGAGASDGPAVTRALIARVTEEPSKAREAWIALLACRGEHAEQFLAYAASRPRLLGQVNRARMWWARMAL